MHRKVGVYALGAVLLLVSGCAQKVLVPPRVDLDSYPTLGIVTFTSNARGNLEEHATRKFMQAVQTAQPGVRILELGGEERVLGAIDRDELDFEAMRAIGEKWGVDAVFSGHLDVQDVKPNLDLNTLLKQMRFDAHVQAGLLTRLVETQSGATVWTRSASRRAPVAHVKVASSGPVDFGASDPEEAYGELVYALVNGVTDDFYSRWE